MRIPLVEITRRVEFSAAHRLHDPRLDAEENQRLYGPCNTDHGHNYAVDVTVRGPLEPSGMVMDLSRLRLVLEEEIFAHVDHKHLNRDVAFLQGSIPTAEVLAVAFWQRLQARVAAFGACRLHHVRVYESRENFVDYRGEHA